MRKLINIASLPGLMCVSSSAAAYVGPGLGMGAVGVILGLLMSIVLAILALFWYPFKRLLRKRALNSEAEETPAAVGDTDGVE